MSVFSERLSLLRKMHGVSQSYLSKQFGFQRSTFGNYELGTREPNIDTLIKIARYFNVTTDFLLGNDVKNPIYSFKDDESVDYTVKEKTFVNRKTVIDFLKNEDNIEYLNCIVRSASYRIDYLEAIDELERSINDE